MSKEVFVSFEVAKLLKEKGFDWECSTYLYTINVYNYGDEPCRFQINDSKNSELASDKMTAPTQQMALRWLKEIHGLWIIIMPCENGDCYFEIYKRYGKIWKNNVYDHTKYENFDEPENAVEAALQYVLTNLI